MKLRPLRDASAWMESATERPNFKGGRRDVENGYDIEVPPVTN